ncbi:hypothetical protein ATK74_0850 [Propionicimonas paludicola]|uniref:Uncharacterized protein n=1 Tax=Propionicimonas paludicola TaxID=185243 RepID=A0A2A9CQA8_9ACTN|nr:hypothetical protein [Propionicimonas paludicola]PFG16316.1 hypothetical protein ATK74_0850 [Propionicimonas paludicola]
MTATDPRKLRGSMAGPGGPFDNGGVVIDGQNAVLLEGVGVAAVKPESGSDSDGHMIAMLLNGRVNNTTDQADVLFLFDVDGAASIITELVDLAARMGSGGELTTAIEAAYAAIDAELGRS